MVRNRYCTCRPSQEGPHESHCPALQHLDEGEEPVTDEQQEYREGHQPWWNDGDKVAGAATTMFMLTIVGIICLALFAIAVKLLF